MIVLWYLFFGAAHEVAHVLSAALLGCAKGLTEEGIFDTLTRIFLCRSCLLPAFAETESKCSSDFIANLVRNTGWISSVVCVLLSHKIVKSKIFINARGSDKGLLIAAYITAIEALATDLFRFHGMTLPLCEKKEVDGTIFFCGNFGIIFLHPSWIKIQNGTPALDILQKMINITMIRGAQSGGVVSFIPKRGGTGFLKSEKQKRRQLVGFRCRVVNRKRTDLSRLLTKKLKHELFNLRKHMYGHGDVVRVLCGHTRFATSSVSNFDGTHPHQWTPPLRCRVYDFDTGKIHRNFLVENFVTHNGDFESFNNNTTKFDLETIQNWLQKVTHFQMPSPVDSAAIAGLVDLIRTKGSFSLSIRYALCFRLKTSTMTPKPHLSYPKFDFYLQLSNAFEEVVEEYISPRRTKSLQEISESLKKREVLSLAIFENIYFNYPSFVEALRPFLPHIHEDEESGYSLLVLVQEAVQAFFDNDLMHTTRLFLENAKGSFGICVTSSLDAHRQICLAARGQTMSIAFYPKKGIICYGSELAAVKAALNVETPGGDLFPKQRKSNRAFRLDLDDFGGEICLLDWADTQSAVSAPNRGMTHYRLMNGSVTTVLFRQGKTTEKQPSLASRLILLEGNKHIQPLPEVEKDLVLSDIQSIPKLCKRIQDEFRNVRGRDSLNRSTALHLARCISRRMESISKGLIRRSMGSVDILLTGCEVSLWLAEQFASDMRKSFPNLGILAVSSNKLLGLFGQGQSIPTVGYTLSQITHDFSNAIVIILSHSGGTFAPLQCSNLLQSATNNIFAVTSEWDTQVGKQLRLIPSESLCGTSSRIFSTGVGFSPAEPCSASVAAMQQLMTNLFEFICSVIIDNARFRRASGAVVTMRDLEILERCNRDNIKAIEKIVGVDCQGRTLKKDLLRTEANLRSVGHIWADHVLENARACIMSFIYIAVTVTTGFPLIKTIGMVAGVSGKVVHLLNFFDALFYFWLPQICVIMIRLVQGRNLRHRMVGRTLVIGDVPWVAQCAEAFVSKVFACSYSIASINVLSGNPTDHLVHRHTHRVVRGTLLICGRPDGRLMALTSAEASVCLSLNQASSIQSLGGTCESVTIGHNPFKLPLSRYAIILDRQRPQFLCEQLLGLSDHPSYLRPQTRKKDATFKLKKSRRCHETVKEDEKLPTSSQALLGAYSDFGRGNDGEAHFLQTKTPYTLPKSFLRKSELLRVRKIFRENDRDGLGLGKDDFFNAYLAIDPTARTDNMKEIFDDADVDKNGKIDFFEFFRVSFSHRSTYEARDKFKIRGSACSIGLQASGGDVFGCDLITHEQSDEERMNVAKSQMFAMELYESRIASLQRFISMTVMFHEMGSKVQSFFRRISFGLLGYRMDRTHSIVRVATTASPVSGAEVRDQMKRLRAENDIKRSANLISITWLRYKQRRMQSLLRTEHAASAKRTRSQKAGNGNRTPEKSAISSEGNAQRDRRRSKIGGAAEPTSDSPNIALVEESEVLQAPEP